MLSLYWQSAVLLGRVAIDLPRLLPQGHTIRQNVARLPLPQDSPQGTVGSGNSPFRLLVFGESTVAGVGMESHRQALGGAFAHAIAEQYPHLRVEWLSVGKNGLTAAAAVPYFAEHVPAQPFDLLLIGLGANDVFRFTPAWRWRKHARLLLTLAARRTSRIVWATVPPVGQFPIFDTPEYRLLRQLIERQRQLTERALQDLQRHSAVPFVYPQVTFNLSHADMFIADGVHPSAKANRVWAAAMAAAIGNLIGEAS